MPHSPPAAVLVAVRTALLPALEARNITKMCPHMKPFIIICIPTLFYSPLSQLGDKIRIPPLVEFLEEEIVLICCRARWLGEWLCGPRLESWLSSPHWPCNPGQIACLNGLAHGKELVLQQRCHGVGVSCVLVVVLCSILHLFSNQVPAAVIRNRHCVPYHTGEEASLERWLVGRD